MQQISVIIIMNDAVAAVGLRHLLVDLFDIEAQWARSPEELADSDSSSADLFVADSAALAANLGFFIPRRAKLAVVSDRETGNDSAGFNICRLSDEKQLIRRLSEIVETTREKRADGNELSQREIDVLCLVAKGLTNKEIADRLFISVNTVLSHRKNISAKLGIRSVSGLSVYAMINGYISDIPEN